MLWAALQRGPCGKKLLVFGPSASKALKPCRLNKDAQHESGKLSFIWSKMRTVAQETAPQITLRNFSKEEDREAQYILVKGDFMQPSTYLTKGLLLVTKSYVTMKGFNAFLDMRRHKGWAHKISSWKYLTIRGPVLPVFLEHKVPPSPPSTPFRACQMSTAAAAQDSMPTEADGKCPWQAPICRWQPSLQQLARPWILLTTMHVSWEEGSSVVKSSGDCSLSDTFTEACERHWVRGPSSSVFGISQARILEWAAISFSRGSSQPRDWTPIFGIAGGFFTTEPPGNAPSLHIGSTFVLGGRTVPREKQPSGRSWWMCHSAKSTMLVHATVFSQLPGSLSLVWLQRSSDWWVSPVIWNMNHKCTCTHDTFRVTV